MKNSLEVSLLKKIKIAHYFEHITQRQELLTLWFILFHYLCMFVCNLNKIYNRLYIKISSLIFKLNIAWDFTHGIQYYLKLSFFYICR